MSHTAGCVLLLTKSGCEITRSIHASQMRRGGGTHVDTPAKRCDAVCNNGVLVDCKQLSVHDDRQRLLGDLGHLSIPDRLAKLRVLCGCNLTSVPINLHANQSATP
jgi:hypothetical protein